MNWWVAAYAGMLMAVSVAYLRYGRGNRLMRTAKNGEIRVDFYQSAPGWVTAVVTELKTGRKAQATAGSERAARAAAIAKLASPPAKPNRQH